MTQLKTKSAFESPFQVRQGQPFVFASPLHRRCFQQLRRNVSRSNDLQVVLGGPGTGKSTLLRLLAQHIGPPTKTIFCDARELETHTLFAHLAKQIDAEAEFDWKSLDFRTFLNLAQASCGDDGSLLILIDEAQTLEDSELENAILIADEGAVKQGRFVVVMAGMPGVERRIEASTSHPSLANASVYTLTTLGAADIHEFILAQLQQSGYANSTFSTAAIQTVAALSHGIPRLINRICNNALVRARIADESVVSQSQAQEASRNLPSAFIHDRSPSDSADVVTPFKAKAAPNEKRPEENLIGSVQHSESLPVPATGSETDRKSSQDTAPAHRDKVEAIKDHSLPQSDKSEPNLGDPSQLSEVIAGSGPNEASRTLAEWNRLIDEDQPLTRPLWPKLMGAAAVLTIVASIAVTYRLYWVEKAGNTGRLIATPNPTLELEQSGGALAPGSEEFGAPQVESESSGQVSLARVETGSTPAPTNGSASSLGEPTSASTTIETTANDRLAKLETVRSEQNRGTSEQSESGTKATLADFLDSPEAFPQNPNAGNSITLGPKDETAPNRQSESITREVSQIAENARQALIEGNFEIAADYVEEGLRLSAESEKLLALTEEIERGRELEVTRLRDQAQTQAASGDYEGALASIDDALTLMPKDADLGVIRQELTEANARAVERRKITTAVARNRDQALALLAKGDYPDALARVDEALALAPQEKEGLLQLRARIKSEQANLLKRRRVLEDATSLGEEALQALIEGNFDTALALANEAVASLPGNEALINLRNQIESERNAALKEKRATPESSRLAAEARSILKAGE